MNGDLLEVAGQFALLGLFLVTGFIYGFGAQDPALFPKYLGLCLVSVALGAMLVLYVKSSTSSNFILEFGWPVILLAGYVLFHVPGLLAAVYPQEGLPLVLKEPVWIFMCLCFAFLSYKVPNLWIWEGRYAALAGVLLVCWGALELAFAMDGTVLTHKATYEMRLSFAHRNIFIQYICLLACFQINALNDNGIWKYIRIAALFFITGMALFSLSRTGWLAMGIVWGVLLWKMARHREWAQVARKKGWVGGLFFILVFGTLLFVIDEFYTFIWHVKTAFTFQEGTTMDRLFMVKRSFEMFLQQPLTGMGAGSWKIAFMQFDQTSMLTDNATLFYQRPHNDFAWLLAEFGIGAALLYTALIAYMAYSFIRRSNWHNRAMGITFVAVFLVVSTTSFPRERIELQAMLIFPLAICMTNEWFYGQSIWKAKAGPKTVLLLLAVSLAALACTTYSFFQSFQTDKKIYSAMLHRDSGKWQEEVDVLESIPAEQKVFDNSSTPLEWYKGLALLNLGKIDEACTSFEIALAQNPHHPHVLNNNGYCMIYKGDTAAAVDFYLESVKNFTRFTEGWLNLATIYYSQYRLEEAYKAIRKADIGSDNAMYKALATKMALIKINNYLDTAPDDGLKKTIEAIRNTPKWSLHVLQNSIANNNTIEEQIVIESIYYKEKTCENNCNEIALLKKKYHVKN